MVQIMGKDIDLPRDASGTVKAFCPKCNKNNDKRTVSICLDNGMFYCERCDTLGKLDDIPDVENANYQSIYSIADVYQEVMQLYDNGLEPGISTGWNNIDKLYTVRKCEMTVITGIPGSGKSTWLDALCVNLNQMHKWKIDFCSPENWPIQRHIANIVEKYTTYPFGRNAQNTERLWRANLDTALKELADQFFFLQPKEEYMHIDAILEILQKAVFEQGIDGIVLDPWNELETYRPTDLTETEYVSQALGKIRRFARNNHVHIWIVAHPTKLKKNTDNTYPVPTLYDISGSANWRNKADNGICIHRVDPTALKTDIHVQKIRFKEIGRLGKESLSFDPDCGIYLET